MSSWQTEQETYLHRYKWNTSIGLDINSSFSKLSLSFIDIVACRTKYLQLFLVEERMNLKKK